MKRLFKITICLVFVFLLSGCLKRDTMEDIKIYTTSYPITYITNKLYGTRSEINSIYPSGVNIDEYKLTDKQVENFSKSGLFIFNGLNSEKDYVAPMIEYNKNLKIINASLAMEYSNNQAELWLDPSNFLKLAQNIKIGLNEYITNHYLKNEINENYESLKLEISNLDATFNLINEAASNNTIIVSSDLWLFLEKYNFNVISIEENENLTEKKLNEVRNLFSNSSVSYIFINNSEPVSETVTALINEFNIETLSLNTITNLTEQQANNNTTYFDLMFDNMELLKSELYN